MINRINTYKGIPTGTYEDNGVYNLTHEDYQEFKQNLSYVGYHVTVFEDTFNCRLEDVGTRANAYWIWQTDYCTPINPHGGKATIYYRLTDSGDLMFDCSDQHCGECKYHINRIEKSEKCLDLSASIGRPSSVRIGRPYIHSWESAAGNTSVVANVFFTDMFCLYHLRYIEPQILSTHINLGKPLSHQNIITMVDMLDRNVM